MLLYCCIIYFFQCLIFYYFEIIPLDQTRHSLIFFPIILTILYIVLSEFKLINPFLFVIILILVPFAYLNTKNVINNKISLFDFNYLNNQKESHILLYDSLSSLAYFEKTNKKVFYVGLNQFKNNYKKLKIPNSFLVVGKHEPLIHGLRNISKKHCQNYIMIMI